MAGNLFSGNRMFGGAGGASPNFRSKRPPMPTMKSVDPFIGNNIVDETDFRFSRPKTIERIPTLPDETDFRPRGRGNDGAETRKRVVMALRGVGMETGRAEFVADLLGRMGA
jgi:hypothetical protein